MHLGPPGDYRLPGHIGGQSDVQAAIPGMEVAYLAVAKERVSRAGRYCILEPDGPRTGSRESGWALLYVGKRLSTTMHPAYYMLLSHIKWEYFYKAFSVYK